MGELGRLRQAKKRKNKRGSRKRSNLAVSGGAACAPRGAAAF